MAQIVINGGEEASGRRNRLFTVGLLASSIGLGGSAAAQAPGATGSAPLALEALRNLALCIAVQHPSTARNYVRTGPFDRSQAAHQVRRYFQAAAQVCFNRLSTRLRANSNVMRGALAEQLYLRGHRAFPEAARTAMAVDFADPRMDQTGVAPCVAARRPEAVDRLLRTEWNGAEERAAMDALLPDFAACRDGAAPAPQTSMLVARTALASALFLRVDGSVARRAGSN